MNELETFRIIGVDVKKLNSKPIHNRIETEKLSKEFVLFASRIENWLKISKDIENTGKKIIQWRNLAGNQHTNSSLEAEPCSIS